MLVRIKHDDKNILLKVLFEDARVFLAASHVVLD